MSFLSEKVEKKPDISQMSVKHEWIEIQKLLEEFSPSDFPSAGWREGLESKREDPHYPDLLRDIQTNGLRAPVCIEKWRNDYYLTNGHHRVAALIDLGYTHVPYCTSFTDSCGEDYVSCGSEDYIYNAGWYA